MSDMPRKTGMDGVSLSMSHGPSSLFSRLLKTNGPRRALRQLILQGVKSARDEAIESKGRVSSEHIDSLNRLVRLLELAASAEESRLRNHLTLGIAIFVTLTVVTYLAFGRRTESMVEVDASVSQVSFVTSDSGLVAENVGVASLGALGLDSVEVGGKTLAADAGKFSTVSERNQTLTLVALRADSGTRVSLAKTELPQQYRITLARSDTAMFDAVVDLTISSPVDMVLVSHSRAVELKKRLVSKGPERVRLRFHDHSISLDLTVPRGTPVELASSPIHVDSLKLSSSPAQLKTPGGSSEETDQANARSWILAGTVAFPDLERDVHRLRATDRLSFDHSSGAISRQRFQDDRIDLNFYGKVRQMTFRAGASERSLMPTWFEWFRSGSPFVVVWAAVASGFGIFKLLMSALRSRG